MQKSWEKILQNVEFSAKKVVEMQIFSPLVDVDLGHFRLVEKLVPPHILA